MFNIKNDKLVKELTKSKQSLLFNLVNQLHYDEESEGIFLTDNNLFIMDYEKLETLAKGIMNFLECSDKESIEEYNKLRLDKYFIEESRQSEESIRERQKEKEEFIKKYDTPTRELSETQIDKYLEGLFIIDKNYISTEALDYPLIIILYKNKEVMYISKVLSSLEAAIARYKKDKDFDGYSIVHVNEKYLEDVFTTVLVKFNPKNISKSIPTINNSIYRSLSQIKRRYKDDPRVDLRIIKKIIEIYEIPRYILSSGTQLVEKDKFEQAFHNYFL